MKYLLLPLNIIFILIFSIQLSVAADTDSDTLPDGWEIANGRNHLKPDYAIAGAFNHFCYIDERGVKCEGINNSSGQLDVPFELQNKLLNPYALSAGNTWSCACHDGGETCWGAGFPASPTCTISTQFIDPSAFAHYSAKIGLGGNCFDRFGKLAGTITTGGEAKLDVYDGNYTVYMEQFGCGSVNYSGTFEGNDLTFGQGVAQLTNRRNQSGSTSGAKIFITLEETGIYDYLYRYPETPGAVTWQLDSKSLSSAIIDSDGDGIPRPYDLDDLDPNPLSLDGNYKGGNFRQTEWKTSE